MAGKIKFTLSVCEDRAEVTFKGNKYMAGHRGEIDIDHKIENDILKIDLSEIGHKPQVGGASKIVGVSVRVCERTVSTIAVYDDPEMNLHGCCYSDPVKGCSVYGEWGCSC